MRRRLVLALAVVLGAAVAAGLWLGWTGLQARDELAAAQAGVAQVRSEVGARDLEAARRSLGEVQASTARAHDLTSDPVWSAAGVVPFVGDDVDAVATLAAEVDVLATDVLPPLVEAATVLDPQALRPVDGTIELERFARAEPLLTQAVDRLGASTARVADVDASGLLAPVADARSRLLGVADEAADVLEPAAAAAALLPGMLGADGPRDYLVLFQNNAEIRATGGMPGAFAVVRAEGGRLTLVSQGTPAQVTDHRPPVAGLPADTARLFEDEPAIYFQDVNFTADFPLAATLARTMYSVRTGVEVDGVVATDPVALSHLLAASGPVQVPGGPVLTADTAVDLLLHGIYVDLAGQSVQQNEVYAAAAAAVFSTLTAGTGEPQAVLDALGRSVSEGRLMLWSADPAEQELVAGTALAGPLRPAGTGADPTGAGASTPVVGVFLNGAVASKLDYFLRQRVSVSEPRCRLGDLTRFDVTVELTSTAPADAATSLPADVLGPADLAPPGVNRVQVLTYAPDGGSFGQVLEGGVAKPFGSGSDSGRPVALTTVLLDPGETASLVVEVLLPTPASVTPVIRTTPTVEPATVVRPATSPQRVPWCG